MVLSSQWRSTLPFTLHVVDSNRRIDAFDQMRAKRLTLKLPFDQALRRRTDDHRVGLGQSLNPRGNVRRLAQREQLALFAAADLTNDD